MFFIIPSIHKLYFSAEEIPGEEHKAPAVAYFTHSGTLLKLLAHLGLYRDESALLHSNFHAVGKHRKWRVGQIDSFGSNLAFILFRCVLMCFNTSQQ
jgi:hypothetical protein